jgi:hypothetical protein
VKKLIPALGAAALILSTAGSATAAPAEQTIGNAAHFGQRSIQFFDNDTGAEPATEGSITWSTGGVDSPNDRNEKALHAQVPAGTPDGNYFATFSSDKSVQQDKLVGNVKNLSFDIRSNADNSGGAPRISVEFLNGDVALLVAETCVRTLTNDPRWSRSDFTGSKNDCAFTVSGDTEGTYTSDGTHSAWAEYVTAHPDQRISAAYVVMDAAGNYWIDRIALGTKWEYTGGDKIGVDCQGDESRC